MNSTETNKVLISKAGGPGTIGKLLGISAQAVSGWYDGGVPPERVLAISASTGWLVTPHHFRPDIYPHELDGLPSDDPRRHGGTLQQAA